MWWQILANAPVKEPDAMEAMDDGTPILVGGPFFRALLDESDRKPWGEIEVVLFEALPVAMQWDDLPATVTPLRTERWRRVRYRDGLEGLSVREGFVKKT